MNQYPDIEQQLAEREARHKAHAEKMEAQRLAKLDARDLHRNPPRSVTAQTLK